MKILVVAPQPFYEERGTPIANLKLVRTLTRFGHVVDVLTYPFGNDVASGARTLFRCRPVPGIKQVPIGFSWQKVLMDVSLSASLLRRAAPGRYDVVHANEEMVFPALMLRWRHRATVVYDMDSSLVAQLLGSHRIFRPLAGLFRALERSALRRSAQVFAVCEELADLARRAVPDTGRVAVLHDTPMETEPSGQPIDDIRSGWPDDSAIALYVGNLEAYQGIDLMVAAAARLPADSPARIVVIGGSGSVLADWRSRVETGGLTERVRFVGARPVGDLRAYLEQADVLLSPRTQGGNTPLKLYSYMAAGRPVLATDLTTHTQVLDDSCAALAAPDAGAFADALDALARDPEHRRTLARQAERRVSEKYSTEAYEKILADGYARLRR